MNVYDFSAVALDGAPVDLQQYHGKVALVVNTASECGFTPQYQGLEELYRRYRDRGFVVLAFPSNQFGEQEPGSADEIRTFCASKYGVTFPLFAKTDVNGDNAHPLWQHLKKEAPGLLGTQAIKWNFTKFLVRPDGTVFKRYAPNTAPADIAADIEALLAA
ncbi:glutathione peroxidase [Massilia arenosa]|uniref:Glutathione peroxidase n=1 Tax=Zemynaea arenosa TaxID=2561931 RepID=A0A4Y9RSX4_9BURK|nr:glutathione peroxidase [Massilia arenosa]TFW10639.1 glutathione peroxidase [Massilia arenosa]